MEIQKTYAVFSETNADDMETWMTFILKKGNEDNLRALHAQLADIDWSETPEEVGKFAIDITGVSTQTAREMMTISLNTRYDPNKFEGPVSRINFKFKNSDSDEEKAWKVHELMSDGNGCSFFGQEDLEGMELVGSDDSSYYTDDETESKTLDKLELPELLRKKKGK
jgi:hypothetical protein